MERDPVAMPVDPDSVTEPRTVLRSENVTIPAGAAFPLAAFTFATSKIVEGFPAGPADTVVAVAIGGDCTVTVTYEDEFAKEPVAE